MIGSLCHKLSASFDAQMREILRGAGISVLLRVIGAGLGFAFNVVLARLVGAEGTGLYVIAFSLVSTVAIMGRMGLDTAALRLVAAHHSAGNHDEIIKISSVAVRLGIVASLFLTAVFYFLAPFLAQYAFSKPELVQPLRLMSLAVLPLTLMMLYSEMLKAVKRIRDSQLVQVALVPLLSLCMLFFFGKTFGVNGAVLSYAVGAIGTAFVGFLLWKRTATGSVKIIGFEGARELLSLGIPLMWVNILLALGAWTDTMILGIMRPAAEVGIYSAASRTAMLTSLILVAVNNVVAPKFAALYNRGDLSGLARLAIQSARLTLLFAAPMLLVIAVVPETILGIFGSGFKAGADVLLILLAGQFVNAASGSVGQILAMTGHAVVLRNITIIFTLFNIVLNVLLIKVWGLIGAAITTTTTGVLLNVAAIYYVRKILGIDVFIWSSIPCARNIEVAG